MVSPQFRFKKILLINPPGIEQDGYHPCPLGILYLSAYLKKKVTNVRVEVIDGTKEGEGAVRDKLRLYRPDLVGISALTPGRHQALRVALITKKYIPHCKVVFGGVHPTLMWPQMMKHYPVIDYVVKGEGEITLTELVTNVNLANIKGLVWRKGKTIINNADRPLIKNLDKIPFPDRDVINPLSYPARGQGTVNGINLEKETPVSIIFSRGCMGTCTFCVSWKIWKGYRSRSGKKVADEVEMLYDKFHVKHISFLDDTLTGNRKEIIIFCQEIIKRGIKVAFFGTTRVDCVDKELLRLMKMAGFYILGYGIETGSPEMLQKINKKTNLKKNLEVAKWTKKAGIRFYALMMLGLPGETDKDKNSTYQLIKKMKPYETGCIGVTWIFPGTILYLQAKNAGLINDNFWLSKRPYYIYRGGLSNDPLQKRLLLKDWYEFYIEGTKLERILHPLLIFKRRFLNVWLYHLNKFLSESLK